MTTLSSNKKAYMLKYRLENADKIRAKQIEYRKAHADKISSDQKNYRESHSSTLKIKKHQWYLKNANRIRPEKKIQKAVWCLKNPEKRKWGGQAYRARLIASGDITTADIQRVYENNIKRFGTLTCYLCKKSIKFGQDSIDHKLPITRGGNNSQENLDIAHRACNSRKNNRTFEEYIKAPDGRC